MTPDETGIDRRALLKGGAASAVLIGSAACTDGATMVGATTPPPRSSALTPPPPSSAPTPASPAPPRAVPPSASRVPAVLQTPGPDIRTGPADVRAVALTFHGAGAPALTEEVLRTCHDLGATITVFAVGTWLSPRPRLGRAIVAAGHDLGNHTWSHQTMPRLDAVTAAAEVRDGARAVAAIKGSSPWLFRPSGSPSSTPVIRAAAAASGYQRCISYDVDPADYLDPGADLVARRTLAAVAPGSIVSLHLGHAGTVQALPVILRGLAKLSLKAVSVTQLLA